MNRKHSYLLQKQGNLVWGRAAFGCVDSELIVTAKLLIDTGASYTIVQDRAMAKREKLIAALSGHPNNVTFSQVQALLEIEGFILVRVTGSHHIFNKGEVTFVIPVHKNRVKSIYLKRVLDLIEATEIEGEAE